MNTNDNHNLKCYSERNSVYTDDDFYVIEIKEIEALIHVYSLIIVN